MKWFRTASCVEMTLAKERDNKTRANLVCHVLNVLFQLHHLDETSTHVRSLVSVAIFAAQALAVLSSLTVLVNRQLSFHVEKGIL